MLCRNIKKCFGYNANEYVFNVIYPSVTQITWYENSFSVSTSNIKAKNNSLREFRYCCNFYFHFEAWFAVAQRTWRDKMTARYGKSNMHWAGIFCNEDLFLDYCARYQTWFIVQSKKETKSLNPFQSTMKLICIQIKLHDIGWIQCHSKLKLRWTSIVCLAYECNWLKHKSKSFAIVTPSTIYI